MSAVKESQRVAKMQIQVNIVGQRFFAAELVDEG